MLVESPHACITPLHALCITLHYLLNVQTFSADFSILNFSVDAANIRLLLLDSGDDPKEKSLLLSSFSSLI